MKKANRIKKPILCRLGFHNWEFTLYNFYGSSNERECTRCGKEEVEEDHWAGSGNTAEYRGSEWTEIKKGE